jgi:hypothetical protein
VGQDVFQWCLQDPSKSQKYRVRSGRSSDAPIDLPWLDVDRPIVIGAGAAYGDDTWLFLDYRSSDVDPRVLVNEWFHTPNTEVFQPRGAPSLISEISWREVGSSFSRFVEYLELEPR